uniref:Uncharacterized protein n=1 Tax=Leersia perrieri TaxID=77586 RepID=A0A0D9V3J1_9ORYZ
MAERQECKIGGLPHPTSKRKENTRYRLDAHKECTRLFVEMKTLEVRKMGSMVVVEVEEGFFLGSRLRGGQKKGYVGVPTAVVSATVVIGSQPCRVSWKVAGLSTPTCSGTLIGSVHRIDGIYMHVFALMPSYFAWEGNIFKST